MKENIWAKTILTAYRYLERLAGAIDKMVETSGLNSRFMSGSDYQINNILNLADKMIELSERKIKLINLKILTENVLEKCGESFASLLISKYIDGKKNAEIAEENELALRTYFRRLNGAESRFMEVLKGFGYNEARIEKELYSERWIMEIKSRILSSRSDEFYISENSLDRLAVS